MTIWLKIFSAFQYSIHFQESTSLEHNFFAFLVISIHTVGMCHLILNVLLKKHPAREFQRHCCYEKWYYHCNWNKSPYSLISDLCFLRNLLLFWLLYTKLSIHHNVEKRKNLAFLRSTCFASRDLTLTVMLDSITTLPLYGNAG